MILHLKDTILSLMVKKKLFFYPRKVENGYFVESGLITNNKNIDIPNSSAMWKI